MVAGLVLAGAMLSCLVQTTDGENIATTSARLSVYENRDVTGSLHDMHETSVVSALYDHDGQLVSHWVVGFNNCVPDAVQGCQDVNTIAGWATSSDETGSVWTAHTQASGQSFGAPGEFGARSVPTGGGTFAGWRGDPSLAVVTDPELNQGGRRIIYANLGNSSLHPVSDIAVALSDDGGETWGHAQFANEPASGEDVDQPKLASNPSAPYGTYVAWTSNSGSYINKISYDKDFTFSSGMPVWGQPVEIPAPVLPATLTELPIWHPTIIAFTVQKSCQDGEPHEALWVTWADNGEGRCPENVASDSREEKPTSWFHAIYDTLDGWSGPWIFDEDRTWPQCVGLPITEGLGRLSSNTSNPAVAFDPLSETFWVAHTQSTEYGTRVRVQTQRFVCEDGHLVPQANPGVAWQPANPCYKTSGPCLPGQPNGPDGGFVTNDEWGPALAFMLDETTTPSVPRLAVTWYDTRYDQGNRLVRVFGAESVDYGDTFGSLITQISFAGSTPSGQTVPWDHMLGAWWDYHQIGVDKVHARFLDAWGGDARLGVGASGIWSANFK